MARPRRQRAGIAAVFDRPDGRRALARWPRPRSGVQALDVAGHGPALPLLKAAGTAMTRASARNLLSFELGHASDEAAHFRLLRDAATPDDVVMAATAMARLAAVAVAPHRARRCGLCVAVRIDSRQRTAGGTSHRGCIGRGPGACAVHRRQRQRSGHRPGGTRRRSRSRARRRPSHRARGQNGEAVRGRPQHRLRSRRRSGRRDLRGGPVRQSPPR